MLQAFISYVYHQADRTLVYQVSGIKYIFIDRILCFLCQRYVADFIVRINGQN